jgi:hypothetical protein
MSLWLMLAVVAVAGAAGGLLNAYFTDNGFVWPRVESVGAFKITRPGFLGSMLVGAIAAAVSWGLYGPFASMAVFGATEAVPAGAALTVSALVGAVLVGVGGGRWLTDQADKSLLKATAAHAAQGQGSAEASAAIAAARPAQALEIARKM